MKDTDKAECIGSDIIYFMEKEISVSLKDKYKLKYDKINKLINIVEKENNIEEKHTIVGYLKGFSNWGDSNDANLEFETEDGYCFDIRCSQIEKYSIIKF